MTEPDTALGAEAPVTAQPDLPGKPTDLGRGSWRAAGRRAVAEFKNDFLQDRAAALTYYSVQAIFPGILALVSLLGLFGRSATQPLITNLASAVPSTARTILLDAVKRLQHGHSAAGVLTTNSCTAPPGSCTRITVPPRHSGRESAASQPSTMGVAS